MDFSSLYSDRLGKDSKSFVKGHTIVVRSHHRLRILNPFWHRDGRRGGGHAADSGYRYHGLEYLQYGE
jgi:hypothetical protein